MTEKFQKINNPLTIIAIFAALAEINATIAIGLIDKQLHYIFIWFVIGFPTLLVICFFLTLNYNTKVMYSPSDYKDDKSFMDSLFGSNFGNKSDNKNNDDLNKLYVELESKITEKLNKQIDNIQSSTVAGPDLKKEIESIKTQIKQVTEDSLNEIREESLLKGELKEKMLGFFQQPAFYLLIYAIDRSNATSIKEIKAFSEKFYIPDNWEEGGLKRLFKNGLIIGDSESFTINEEYKTEIRKWTTENEIELRTLSKKYSKIDEIESKEEKSMFRATITRESAIIKF